MLDKDEQLDIRRGRRDFAKRDYIYGYSCPALKQTLVGVAAKFVTILDSGEIPEALAAEAVGVNFKKSEMQVVELGHIWLLTVGKAEWMIRKVNDDLKIYDCSVAVTNRYPSIRMVADWHDIPFGTVRTAAQNEKWKGERDVIRAEIENEAMATIREQAIADYRDATRKHLAITDEMLDQYSSSLYAGKEKVTTRDAISAIGVSDKIHRGQTTLGQKEPPRFQHIQMLIQAGIAEVVPKAEPEIIDAEVINVEEIPTEGG